MLWLFSWQFRSNVVVFAKPCHQELEVVQAILGCFGAASGLVVNFAKSLVIDEVAPALSCPIGPFPCKYLRLEWRIQPQN
jgi:hypothetical protein